MSRYVNSWDIQRHEDGMTVLIFSHLLSDENEQMEPIVLTEIDALALGSELSELNQETLPSKPTVPTNSVENSSEETHQETLKVEPSPQPPSQSEFLATPAKPADTAGPIQTSPSQPTKNPTDQ